MPAAPPESPPGIATIPAKAKTGPGTNRGVLLVNLGTPDAPTTAAVRRYLAEFLADPYVIDIPAPLRFLLLHLVILPFRPRRAAKAYQQIWTERGSPLRTHGEDLTRKLQGRLARPIALGMRYGNPGIGAALDELRAAGAASVTVLPLFPQYSDRWETAVVETRRLAEARGLDIGIHPPFFDHPGFLDSVANQMRTTLNEFEPDQVMQSFHGLPERHIRRTDRSGGRHCLANASCCDAIVDANRNCYRAQCYATARGIAERLALEDGTWHVAFQSRLGRTPWIEPFTDIRVVELARSGCRRLAVVCPSFVADCLETLEEIQIRARESFIENGGEDLRLVPAVNSNDSWVETLAGMLDA